MSKSKKRYVDKEELATLKLTGKRLAAARELCNLNQTEAAKLINTSKQALKDAESGKLNPLPITRLKSAAETYNVSADWLLGLVNDWERDPKIDQERDFLAGLQRIHLKHYSRLVALHLEG